MEGGEGGLEVFGNLALETTLVVLGCALQEALAFEDCAFLFRWVWWAESLKTTLARTRWLRAEGRVMDMVVH